MKGAAAVGPLLLLAALTTACGVPTQSAPSKLQQQTPTSTPTPNLQQNTCPPTSTSPSAIGLPSSAAPSSNTVPCDLTPSTATSTQGSTTGP